MLHRSVQYAPTLIASLTLSAPLLPRHHRNTGFFKGLAPAVTVSIPVQIVYYGSYEYSRYLLAREWWGAAKGSQDNDFAEFCIDATAGAIGEIMSGALWVPADLVSQRLMLQGPDHSKHLYTGMIDAVRKIWRAEGARGFYVGFGASLLTHIPNSATCWAVYEYSKKQLYRHWWWPRQGIPAGQVGSERTDGSHIVNLISAVTAGVVASAVSTPFDVIRVRKQAEGLSTQLYSAQTSAAPNQTQQNFHDARVYRGNTFLSMRTLVAEAGWTGLFRGLVPRCLAAAPQSALLLVAYDLVKNLAKIDPPSV